VQCRTRLGCDPTNCLRGIDLVEIDIGEKGLETAKHPRWDRPYTELAYQPMLELLRHLRHNEYKTYIVTGGGQDFVRVYAQYTASHPNRLRLR
jgi:phosphoglycolate phosphatase-like HAD superfamily hydrolase